MLRRDERAIKMPPPCCICWLPCMAAARGARYTRPVPTAHDESDRVFPKNFLWGISTSAHQVEGGTSNNQWAAWEAAGRIRSGDCCGRACDWWSNAECDFDLAQEMGLNALRISVEWSRIEPRPGVWDQQTLERYREMLRGLHERGIRPLVCLHHFTHPMWFENLQGFLATDAPARFERFVRTVVNGLGDLCQDWVTFNEPNVYCAMGYAVGLFPPGRRGELFASMKALAGILRAHSRAYRAIHELQANANVGWAHNYVVFQPLRPWLPFDRWITRLHHSLFNDSFVRAIAEGTLPLGFGRVTGDLSEARGTCDFVGLNVYGRLYVCFDPRKPSQLFGNILVPEHVPRGRSWHRGPACRGLSRSAEDRGHLCGAPGQADLHSGERRSGRGRPHPAMVAGKRAPRIARGAQRRHRHPRLFPLDPDRQLRMERRLEPALRAGRTRYRNPAPHPPRERPDLCRDRQTEPDSGRAAESLFKEWERLSPSERPGLCGARQRYSKTSPRSNPFWVRALPPAPYCRGSDIANLARRFIAGSGQA